MRRERKSRMIPEGFDEKEVLEELDRVVNMLASSFTFGHYGLEDIKQEARIYGLEALPLFDKKRKLSNFLYCVIKSRLTNLRRNKYWRNDPPCQTCHFAFMHGEKPEHENKEYCNKYRAWRKRNFSKQELMKPLSIDFIDDENEKNTRFESNMEANVQGGELARIIDMKLDISLRPFYLKMLEGRSIPKGKKCAVQEAIREILDEYNGKEE